MFLVKHSLHYLQILSQTFLILIRIQRGTITFLYPLFLSYFNQTCKTFSKNTQISNFTTNLPVGAELFHADGQTHSQTDGRTGR
jgi:hypothetical protein